MGVFVFLERLVEFGGAEITLVQALGPGVELREERSDELV